MSLSVSSTVAHCAVLAICSAQKGKPHSLRTQAPIDCRGRPLAHRSSIHFFELSSRKKEELVVSPRPNAQRCDEAVSRNAPSLCSNRRRRVRDWQRTLLAPDRPWSASLHDAQVAQIEPSRAQKSGGCPDRPLREGPGTTDTGRRQGPESDQKTDGRRPGRELEHRERAPH